MMRHFVVGVVLAGLAIVGSRNAEAQSQGSGSSERAAIRFDVIAGTKASYRVREQLLGFNFPNDAVGTTQSVSGDLTLAPDGAVAAGSRVTVDLRTMKSDDERRDAWLRDRTIQTDRFPTADFVPRRIQGLALPVPASGTSTLQLIGDMTVHGVTSEVSWTLDATFSGDRVTGRARTNFPFAKFGLTIPRLPGILSLDDNIRLELELTLRRSTAR